MKIINSTARKFKKKWTVSIGHIYIYNDENNVGRDSRIAEF